MILDSLTCHVMVSTQAYIGFSIVRNPQLLTDATAAQGWHRQDLVNIRAPKAGDAVLGLFLGTHLLGAGRSRRDVLSSM